MRYWVKLWTEMLDDPKMGRLTDRQHRLCTNLFCLAGIIDDDGHLLNTADIAYKVRRDIDSVAEDLAALATVNIVELVDGVWQLVHFEKRNERPPSADREAVRERVAKSREKKQGCNEDVTSLHEDVTRVQRDVTPPDKIRSDQTRQDEDQTTPETDKGEIVTAVVVALAPVGISESTVKKHLPDWKHPEHAAAIVRLADRTKGIRSRSGFVLSKLAEGWTPPDNGCDPPEPTVAPDPPDPPPDIGDCVPYWPESLLARMDPSTYNHHFLNSTARFVDSKVIVAVPAASLLMVEKRLRPTIEAALAEYGKTVVIEGMP